ncbi:hypothetical protein D3C85_1178070 [compost metagenome]
MKKLEKLKEKKIVAIENIKGGAGPYDLEESLESFTTKHEASHFTGTAHYVCDHSND